jgi:hypothetical protein
VSAPISTCMSIRASMGVMLNARSDPYWAVSIGTTVFVLITSLGCPLDNTIALVASLTSNRNMVEDYVHQVKLQYQVSDPNICTVSSSLRLCRFGIHNLHLNCPSQHLDGKQSGSENTCFQTTISADSFYHLCRPQPLSTDPTSPVSARRTDGHCELACREGKAGDP